MRRPYDHYPLTPTRNNNPIQLLTKEQTTYIHNIAKKKGLNTCEQGNARNKNREQAYTNSGYKWTMREIDGKKDS